MKRINKFSAHGRWVLGSFLTILIFCRHTLSMDSFKFSCTCRANFASSEERDAHLKEEETKRLKQRQIAFDLQQYSGQSLSHSNAEDDIFLAADSLKKAQNNPLAKHKGRNGYHCPRENCYVKCAGKLPGFREHYGTRKMKH